MLTMRIQLPLLMYGPGD